MNEINAKIQERMIEIQQHVRSGAPLPKPPHLPSPAVLNPPLAQARIIDSHEAYPPVSSGIFICTNYFEAPTLDVQVLAGAFRADPGRGVFVVTSHARTRTVYAPTETGIPTFTQVKGTTLRFETSTGYYGQFDYQTGNLVLNSR